MRDMLDGASQRPSPLRYLPATLAAGACLALLLFFPAASQWAGPWFYSAFLKGKGGSPPSRSTVLVKPDRADLDDAALLDLVRSILDLHPAVLAFEAPGLQTIEAWAGAPGGLPQGPVVVGLPFRDFRPWSLSESAVAPYPPILARSLYPLIDGPSGGDLKMPMGEGLVWPDSLRWASATLGFSGPLPRGPVWSVPAFARLGRGVAGSIAMEAARRALGQSAERVTYVEGLGVLFDPTHLLPLTGGGESLLRLHDAGGIPVLSPSQVRREDVQGKAVFLDLAPRKVATLQGPRTEAELWANATDNVLEGTALATPAWERALSIALGVIFSGLLALSLSLELGGFATFCLGILLLAVYPAISFWFFLRSSWWLPPELPVFMVLGAYLPFAFTRLFARGPAPLPFAPAPARSHVPPMLPPMPPTPPRGTPQPGPLAAMAAAPAQPLTPQRGIPVTAAPAPQQQPRPAPAQPPAAPAQPLAEFAPQAPKPRPLPARERQAIPESMQMPPAPQPQGQPAPRPAGAVHTGSIADEIERDSKGGLVRVGKYRIVRKMGFGSGGDVFEGFDTHMGRKVAIKTLTKDAGLHFDRAAERFAVEAKAAGSLNHPCINIIYDFGTIRDVSYMVLEFLDGITLSHWMKTNPVPSPRAAGHWVQQMASALDFAHANHIIHRDLKPTNLMIVNGGATIKLLDFGIAKMDDVMLTQTGMTVGTPSYMSPEQLMGSKITPASDQYGLAVVTYQMFTYKLPYIGTKIPELCNRILKNDIVPITEANPALGAPLWEALRKAMAKNPEDRYPSCIAMFQALEAAFPPG
jgi:hypothetical protein